MPSMTSSPISTRMPPTTLGVDDDVEVDGRGRTARLSAAASRVRLGLVERRRATRTAATPLAVRAPPRPSGTPRAPRATVRWVPASGLLGEPHRRRRAPCPRAGRASSARLSSAERAGSRERVAQLGVLVERAGRPRTARRRRRPASARRSAPTATTPRCSSASARSRGDGPAAPDSRRRAGRADGRPTLPPKRLAHQPGLGRRPSIDDVGDHPAQAAARGAATSATPKQVLADPCGRRARRRPETAPPAGSPASASASADGPRMRASAALRRRSARPARTRGSRGRRGTGRPRALARSSSSRLSPTMRPASEVASVPTSARSEVTACWRSASIWALPCSTMRADSVWACSRISATICAPCSRASSRMRAASCRASASCFSQLGELGVGLGLLGLGRREAALDGRRCARRRSSRSSGRRTS